MLRCRLLDDATPPPLYAILHHATPLPFHAIFMPRADAAPLLSACYAADAAIFRADAVYYATH